MSLRSCAWLCPLTVWCDEYTNDCYPCLPLSVHIGLGEPQNQLVPALSDVLERNDECRDERCGLNQEQDQEEDEGKDCQCAPPQMRNLSAHQEAFLHKFCFTNNTM